MHFVRTLNLKMSVPAIRNIQAVDGIIVLSIFNSLMSLKQTKENKTLEVPYV